MTDLIEELRKWLKQATPEAKSTLIDQLMKEKKLYEDLKRAGLEPIPTDVSERARLKPEGILSLIEKINLVDRINVLEKISEVLNITKITDVTKIERTALNLESGKTANTLVTTYMKNACILPSNTIVADPTGMMVSYEGGYACRALIIKQGQVK